MILENTIIKTDSKGESQNSIYDYVKILEISNFIDEWEQNVLFSKDGFYSLKGKSVIGKTQTLLDILNEDIEKMIYEADFVSSLSSKQAEKIKSAKVKTISEKMLEYELKEKQNWMKDTIEQTINYSKNKAKEYKNYPDTIEKCYKNGLSALGIKSELEGYSKEQTHTLINEFNSDFFEGIVWSFIDDNSDFAMKFYEMNKNYIFEDKQTILEKSLIHLENKLFAIDTAKKMLFDGLNKEQARQKISKIKDDEIRKFALLYFEGFMNSKHNFIASEKEELNRKIWENIDKLLEENSDLALFEVNLNQDEKSINSQINYIKTMIKSGKIETEDNKFFELYKMVFEDKDKFATINLYDFKHCLDSVDFDYFKDLKESIDTKNFLALKNEYIELRKHFKNDIAGNVLLIKTFNFERNILKEKNNNSVSLIQVLELIERIAGKKS